MTDDVKHRLTRAIENAKANRVGAFSAEDVADDVISTNPTLWEMARDQIAREKLISIITGTFRGPLAQVNSAQLALPGFEDIPKYIRVKRKWVPIQNATAAELQEFYRWYDARLKRLVERTKRDRQILQDIERLTRIVTRYAKKDPEITVKEVLAIREVRAELRQYRQQH